jgi:hypothetical protein
MSQMPKNSILTMPCKMIATLVKTLNANEVWMFRWSAVFLKQIISK